MTTHKDYIAPKDKVLLTDQKYTGTTWTNYESTDAGKMPKIVETSTGSGVYELKLVEGTTQLHFEIFSSLPTAGEGYAQTIALIARTGTTEEKNVYTEYACVKTSSSPDTWVWEKLGDLTATITQTKDKITVNATDLQFASYTDASNYTCGVISGVDYNKLANAVQKDSASAKTFTLGCDANGPYVSWDDA